MRSFRGLLDDLQLDELHLAGRLYTWSNHRDSPTLERLDRVFATVEWLEQHPCHHLRCLSSDSSDHAPLLLLLNSEPWARPRFRFDDYWTKLEGFGDVISVAWNGRTTANDPCRTLDQKLQAVARAPRSWQATRVGNIRLQLAAARAVIYELDTTQESRILSAQEIDLQKELKHAVLGPASLCRTMARQCARVRHLAEGDACTRYFHLQACHRRRKNYLLAITHNGETFTEEEAKADLVFSYYNGLLGTPFTRTQRINLGLLGLPQLDLSEQAAHFTAAEIAHAIKESPANRAPGPDGFVISFYRATWGVVGCDVVRAFQALWELDFRSFHHLNEAVMVLLHKTQSPAGLKDYRPISLIHSIGKLFSKCLALRLAPRMGELIKHNQSAFIRGRHIHENFKTVQLTCRWLHAQHCPTVLLKIDLAKAFDSVAWPFLLEAVEHAGLPQRWRNWISAMLCTASTRVLVNGCPGRRICHARGLRQGDPLSPLLFVLVMEVLNALIHEADRRGIFSPLPGKIKHRASIYADDLVIFLTPDTSDFVNLRRILNLFTALCQGRPHGSAVGAGHHWCPYPSGSP